jgi:FKBP-type peptidyl-prolyl cis-trans isomerase FklB
VTTDLEGNITSYTDKLTAKQFGKYDTTSFYGPKVMSTTEGTMPAGLAEALIGMKEGGRKKVIIPSWLMSHMSYETEEEYLASSSSSASTIYDITVRTYTDSIQLHEINLIEDYIKKNPQIFNSKMVNDTTGFYYQPLSENISTEKFEKDTTIYINYIGRLLNGLVFDTTIEKVAKDNGIYSSSRTYGPTEVNWGEKYDDLTLGSSKSTVIPGFALTLWHMHPMEKGMGVFYSPLGYSFNGSGSSIPGYAPLIFEIEIVAKPK